MYNFNTSKKIKLVTQLRLGLSHLRGQVKHNFQESLNPLCKCCHDIKSTTYFFLHCSLFANEIYTLLSILNRNDCSLLNNTDSILTKILIFLHSSLNSNKNLEILIVITYYILSTKRSDEAIF